MAHAERRQENTQKCEKHECPGGCPCCVIVRQPCGSALHKLHRQPCAQVASYVMGQGIYIEIALYAVHKWLLLRIFRAGLISGMGDRLWRQAGFCVAAS